MTQKEIVKTVLAKLGGCASVEDICVLAKHYIGDSSTANEVEANIRRILNTNPNLFQHPDGVERGAWALVSYKSELSEKNEQIAKLTDEIAKLKKRTLAEDVEKRIAGEIMERYKHKRSDAGQYRYILEHAGCKMAVALLDMWMSEKDVDIINFFNVSTTFSGSIEQVLLNHADVVAGIAESGSNVFHHQSK